MHVPGRDARIAPELGATIAPGRSWPLSMHQSARVVPAVQPTEQLPVEEGSREHLLQEDERFQLQPDGLEYHVVKYLAAGGFGEVYELEYDGKRYAAKVAKLKEADAQDRAQRNQAVLELCLEAGLTKRLGSHPNLVGCAFIHVGQQAHANEIFVLMDLLGAGCMSLSGAITRWNQEYGTDVAGHNACAHRVAVDVLRGLAWMHAQDVLHQDIKPDNIMIDADGTAKITDFGLSARGHRAAEDGVLRAKLKGMSFAWASPEVTREYLRLSKSRDGAGEAGEEEEAAEMTPAMHDLWAVGIVFLQLFLRSNAPVRIWPKFREALGSECEDALPQWEWPRCRQWLEATGVPPELVATWDEDGRDGAWLASLPYVADRSEFDPEHVLKMSKRKALMHRIQALTVPSIERAVIQRCLADAPSARFATADEGLAALGQDDSDGNSEAVGVPADNRDLASALAWMGGAHASMGEYQRARPLLEESAGLLPQDSPDGVPAMNAFAFTLQHLGERGRAQEIFERNLELLRATTTTPSAATNKDDASLMGNTLHLLASLCLDAAEYDRAEALELECLQIRREAPEANDTLVAESLASLARVHQSRYNYSRAVELLREGLALARASLGPKHPKVQSMVDALTVCLVSEGQDFAEVLQLCEESLAAKRESLGNEHATVADTLDIVSRVSLRIGDVARAESAARESLTIRQAAFVAPHATIAGSLFALSEVFKTKGDLASALSTSQESLAMREALYADSENHPDIAESLNQVAELYQAQGDLQSALAACERSLAIRRTAYGVAHPAVAQGLMTLAGIKKTLGQIPEAQELCEQSLESHRAVYGERHPAVATSMDNLAQLYQAQHELDRAQALFEESLAMRKQLLGPSHPEVAIGMSNLGMLYRDRERYDDAQPLLEGCLAIWEAALGRAHPQIGAGLNNLAMLHVARGELEPAKDKLIETCAIWKSSLGETHPQVGMALANLASVFERLGDTAASKDRYKEAHALFLASYGPDHPHTTALAKHL